MVAVTNDAVIQPWLDFLWLEITGKCNLTCSHCYADSGPSVALHGTMTYSDWVAVLDEAHDLGCRQMQFIGGEPTLHPRLPDLICHAHKRHFDFIEVYTNATRLAPDLIDCFQHHGVQVATSFYSDDPEVHDRITNGIRSWHRTVEGIQRIVSVGLSLRVGLIEMEHNAGHIPRAVSFLQSLGVTNFKMDRTRGVGRAELVTLREEGERFDELCGECWKGKLCVNSDGDVFPCVFSRATRLGKAGVGLKTLLNSRTLQEFRRTVNARNAAVSSDAPKRFSISNNCMPYCVPCSPCGPATCQPCPPPCDPCR